MNINKDNYEEYFLLYADNELSKAERKMVKIFVQENPEFKEEFCMLKLTINIPDEEVKLEDKSFLLKNESSFLINKNNYEEIFVLYHDNELSEKEKFGTENFVAQHPNLKAEFELICKAKLSPDSLIVYPDKKELYRKEKSGKVVPLFVWRSLTAAVLIGFGLWIWVPYFTNQRANVPITAQVNPVKKSHPEIQNRVAAEPKKTTTELASSAVNEEKKNIPIRDDKADKPVVKKSKRDAIVRSDVKIVNSSLIKNIKQLKDEPVDAIALKVPIEKTLESPENYKNAVDKDSKKTIQKIEPEVKPNYSQAVAYTTDAAANNNNYVFYDVPTDKFKKSKVGGFLKKMKRIVERTNPITRLLEGNDEPVVAKNF
jgi:hypothetical protein